MTLKLIFWILFFILFYTYLGYALVLFLVTSVKKFLSPDYREEKRDYEPDVCLFVTAYNEKDYIRQKVGNALRLDYPKNKIQYVWVTDGSDDGTPDLLSVYENMEVYHQPERRGKMHAMNRGMAFVKAPVVIFSDSNTFLNRDAIRVIVEQFSHPGTGCVAGEKRILENGAGDAATTGEGLYWKYESWIKKMDAALNSAVGAVGELFAIRRELFEPVEPDTILDDFIISMRIAQKGYKIAYTPGAYAEEAPSLNVKEELKRKIRIAAGGIQALFRLKSLLNPFKYGVLSWQFLSHKVLRWTLAPVALILLLLVNALLAGGSPLWTGPSFYTLFFWFQLFCYMLALGGWYFESRNSQLKFLFLPYYFLSVNYAALRGMFRYFRKNQPPDWVKSKRAGRV